MITEDIAHLAALARIEVSEAEQEKLKADIEAIVAYVSDITAVSGADSAPGTRNDAEVNVFRDDGEPHESGMHTEALLAEAPQREGKYVKVKKIL